MVELELANRFDPQRPQLRAVAYRILGTLTEADDAVQEAWLRLRRTDAEQIDSPERWLTTVLARICLSGASRLLLTVPSFCRSALS
jgi:RNA polymerase sigma-70 factor (ECF subfamily)